MKLVDIVTGFTIKIGHEVHSINGYTYIYRGGSPPRKKGATGHILLETKDGEVIMENYPSIINAKWVKANAK